MKYYWLQKWQKRLGIKTKIRFEYIPRTQVMCDYNRPYHLVGISGNIIYHDRRLTELDVIHELVHHLDRRLSEKSVREITEGLLYGM